MELDPVHKDYSLQCGSQLDIKENYFQFFLAFAGLSGQYRNLFLYSDKKKYCGKVWKIQLDIACLLFLETLLKGGSESQR